jgi:hypothetical protein
MASITLLGSKPGSITLVIPSGEYASAEPPAAWVMGAATRCTGFSVRSRIWQLNAMASHARFSIITALGGPVVPPELNSDTSSSSPCSISGDTSAQPAVKFSSEGTLPSAASMQTRCRMRGHFSSSIRTFPAYAC